MEEDIIEKMRAAAEAEMKNVPKAAAAWILHEFSNCLQASMVSEEEMVVKAAKRMVLVLDSIRKGQKNGVHSKGM